MTEKTPRAGKGLTIMFAAVAGIGTMGIVSDMITHNMSAAAGDIALIAAGLGAAIVAPSFFRDCARRSKREAKLKAPAP
jgi:hypothetical protein